MNEKEFEFSIIQPDDWHVHLRENKMLNTVLDDTARIFKRCIAMPNLDIPLTKSLLAKQYKQKILSLTNYNEFEPYIPCYLSDNIDLKDFENGIKDGSFFGAKLYPVNATTNSDKGVSKIDLIFPALEILEKLDAPLLIHAEKNSPDISIFDREKYFIDDEMQEILKRFSSLKIVIEHISSSYGANFVNESRQNLASTITLHHLMLTKKDVFNISTNPHHLCMPVVKSQDDLVALRKFACSGNEKFFLGTDSAPHYIEDKENETNVKPGIYTSPIAIEMYATIFDQENSLKNFEKFASINGAKFYNLPINKNKINLTKEEWTNPEFTANKNVKIKNFMGGQNIKWKVVDNN